MSGAENAAIAATVAATGAIVAIEAGKTSSVAGYVKAGIAVVNTNPVIFGIFAAVCIGVVVYNIVQAINSGEKPYSHGSDPDSGKGSGSGKDPDSGKGSGSGKDPDSGKVSGPGKGSNNNVRKRNVNGSAPSTTNNNLSTTKEVQNDINQNGNEQKVLPDKNIQPMSSKERVDKYLSENIPASGAENSNSNTMAGSKQAHFETSDSSSRSNISSSKSSNNSERRKYKKNLRSLKKKVDKMIQENSDSEQRRNGISRGPPAKGCQRAPSSCGGDCYATDSESVENSDSSSSASPSECSSTSTESGSSSGSLLSKEPENCIACEQNPVTHVQPCNHQYMCSDCAMKFLKLYKKCKICRAKIESFVKIERVVVEV